MPSVLLAARVQSVLIWFWSQFSSNSLLKSDFVSTPSSLPIALARLSMLRARDAVNARRSAGRSVP